MTYYDWLVYGVAPDYQQRETYIELLYALYSTEFFWVVQRDRNRAKDGLELRARFEKETGLGVDISGPCTCLELFIALAVRCENDLMYDPDYGDRTTVWFWMILDNLGLLEYDTDRFDREEIDEILYRFMNREYGYHGEFCAFPSQTAAPNLKKMELAYQMNHYMKENYY